MRSNTIAALAALNICVCLALPQNLAKVDTKEATAVVSVSLRIIYNIRLIDLKITKDGLVLGSDDRWKESH
mgnify:CR=1 FL=1